MGTTTVNPFGQTSPPRPSGDPDAAPCPICGVETTPDFEPGRPPIHAQSRGPLGTLLPVTCPGVVL